MILGLRKTTGRTGRFLRQALAWRAPDRSHAVVAWGLVGGAVWLAASLPGDPVWPTAAVAGIYLLTVLAAISAIDARFGIIPDSLIGALAVGGLAQYVLVHGPSPLAGIFEAAAVFLATAAFRTAFRMLRGYDGLGFGDVKFVAAASLWIGFAALPGVILIAVVSALVAILLLKADRHEVGGKEAIPFGPHLAIGAWLTWAIGPLQIFS
jgi:leader peptidase (prepilin peptidase)/N-methyltransferase